MGVDAVDKAIMRRPSTAHPANETDRIAQQPVCPQGKGGTSRKTRRLRICHRSPVRSRDAGSRIQSAGQDTGAGDRRWQHDFRFSGDCRIPRLDFACGSIDPRTDTPAHSGAALGGRGGRHDGCRRAAGAGRPQAKGIANRIRHRASARQDRSRPGVGQRRSGRQDLVRGGNLHSCRHRVGLRAGISRFPFQGHRLANTRICGSTPTRYTNCRLSRRPCRKASPLPGRRCR